MFTLFLYGCPKLHIVIIVMLLDFGDVWCYIRQQLKINAKMERIFIMFHHCIYYSGLLMNIGEIIELTEEGVEVK